MQQPPYSASGRRHVRVAVLWVPLALSVPLPLLASSALAQGAAPPVDPAIPELPEVVVTAPSPVAKPKKKASSSPAATALPAPAAAPTPSSIPTPPVEPSAPVTPVPGTLIVVDDAFVPVTVATEREFEASRGATIADTLAQKPGIGATTFAPGSSRPIIRGLDTYRVRVQENGLGTGDVAALSEDHAVPVDPFAAERVEVVRGPATLRYGSQAIGGVVAIENDRIPTLMPLAGFSGEIRGGWTSVDDGADGAIRATAGASGIVVHADGFKRQTDDYDTPRGRQLNTFVDSEGGALGLSMVGLDGYLGVAVVRFDSLYGIPGEEAEKLRPRIDLQQDKVLLRGEWRVKDYGLDAIRLWFGASDYAHNELIDEGGGFEVGNRFTNEEWEGRLEVQHLPVMSSLGALRGAFGVQAFGRDTEGQNLEGGDSLLAPAETGSIAAFAFEELDVTSRLTLQVAGRIEHTEIDGSGRRDPLNAAVPLTAIGRDFTPTSVSLGGLYRLPGSVVASLNGQYVERAPEAAELFSAGVHEATGTFEIGNPDLNIERAATVEVGLRKADGRFRFDATAFYTAYDGFVFKGLTGVECLETLASCGGPIGPDDEPFDQVLFDQRDATFYGVEIAGQYDVAPIWNGMWGIDAQYDLVIAEFEDGGNVPRIPPQRLGGGLYYRDANWFARAGVLHAFDQDRFAAAFGEIATPGYTLVSAEVAYTSRRDGLGGSTGEITIGVKGENLADDEVLNHASFKRREDVLLPGASVRLFGSIKLN